MGMLNYEGVRFEGDREEMNRIYNLIEDVKSIHVNGFGPVTAAKVVRAHPTREELRNVTVADLADIDGISERFARELVPELHLL